MTLRIYRSEHELEDVDLPIWNAAKEAAELCAISRAVKTHPAVFLLEKLNAVPLAETTLDLREQLNATKSLIKTLLATQSKY